MRFQSRNLLCYTRERVKREEECNPPALTTFSLYTISLPPSNHSLCSNVPSKFYLIILHTLNTTLINTSTPHCLTSEHLSPFPSRTNPFRHHLATFLRTFQSLRRSVTQFLPQNLGISTIISKFSHTFVAVTVYPL
jgi:hypothetical protein